MAIYLLDGRLCPALFLDEFDENGFPRRAVYFYGSTEGDALPEMRMSDSLVRVPENNGADWTPANYPYGSHFYCSAPDYANLQQVLDRLNAAYNHREACAKAAQAANSPTGGTEEVVVDESGAPANVAAEDTRPEWKKATKPDGTPFASKAEWKLAQGKG